MAQGASPDDYKTRYEPDLDHLQRFQDARRRSNYTSCPARKLINNRMVWRGNDLKDSYIVKLSALHLAELSAACFAFQGRLSHQAKPEVQSL